MKDDTYLYQHKEMKKTHTVKVVELEALRHNAIDEGLLPCYIVEYSKRRWFMVPEEVWNEFN